MRGRLREARLWQHSGRVPQMQVRQAREEDVHLRHGWHERKRRLARVVRVVLLRLHVLVLLYLPLKTKIILQAWDFPRAFLFSGIIFTL